MLQLLILIILSVETFDPLETEGHSLYILLELLNVRRSAKFRFTMH